LQGGGHKNAGIKRLIGYFSVSLRSCKILQIFTKKAYARKYCIGFDSGCCLTLKIFKILMINSLTESGICRAIPACGSHFSY
jgi:hypothetical protein